MTWIGVCIFIKADTWGTQQRKQKATAISCTQKLTGLLFTLKCLALQKLSKSNFNKSGSSCI